MAKDTIMGTKCYIGKMVIGIKPKRPGKRMQLPLLGVCLDAVLGLVNWGDTTAATFTGFGAGDGD